MKLVIIPSSPAANQSATARRQRVILGLARVSNGAAMPMAPYDLPCSVRDQHQRERQVDPTGGQISSEQLRRRGTHKAQSRNTQSDKAEYGPAAKAETRGDARGLDDPRGVEKQHRTHGGDQHKRQAVCQECRDGHG